MKKELKDIVENFSDQSVAEYKEDILPYLNEYCDNFDTHAMSDHQLYLLGQKNMLEQMIIFLERN